MRTVRCLVFGQDRSSPNTEALAQEWERLRPRFLNDKRTVTGMAVRMGKDYPTNAGTWPVGELAALS
jgi:hypothetical protein